MAAKFNPIPRPAGSATTVASLISEGALGCGGAFALGRSDEGLSDMRRELTLHSGTAEEHRRPTTNWLGRPSHGAGNKPGRRGTIVLQAVSRRRVLPADNPAVLLSAMGLRFDRAHSHSTERTPPFRANARST